jgi:hypothetical protein
MKNLDIAALRESLDRLIRSATDVIARAEALETRLEQIENDCNESGEQE